MYTEGQCAALYGKCSLDMDVSDTHNATGITDHGATGSADIKTSNLVGIQYGAQRGCHALVPPVLDKNDAVNSM
jgi:hypothetical protein